MTEQKKKLGRPSIFTEELANEIITKISNGLSLRELIRDNNHLPNRATIHRWIRDNKEFCDQYAKACSLRDDEEFDEMEEIARNETDVQRAKLILDTRKWRLSKQNPKKYGDRVQNDHGGQITIINREFVLPEK